MSYLVEVVRYLGSGALVSILLFATTLTLSLPLGIVIAYAGTSKHKALREFTRLYIWLFRGTPLMLQLFFFLYGLPELGVRLSRMTVATLTFALNYAAYFAEIVRAGIESIDKDQSEAAEVLGATKAQTFRHILLPQALTRQLPTIANEAVTLIKDTALVTVIAISDLLRQVKELVSRDFRITPFFVAAAFYLIVSYLIGFVFRRLEQSAASPVSRDERTIEQNA
jgi:polar amino acid transport system permease protein